MRWIKARTERNFFSYFRITGAIRISKEVDICYIVNVAMKVLKVSCTINLSIKLIEHLSLEGTANEHQKFKWFEGNIFHFNWYSWIIVDLSFKENIIYHSKYELMGLYTKRRWQ